MAGELTEGHPSEQVEGRTEARWRSLIENVSDIVMVIDSTDRVSYVSPSIERVLGYKPADVVGTEGLAVIHPEDLPTAAAAFALIRQTDGVANPLLFRVMHADRSWRHLESVVVNRLADPTVQGIVIVSRDVTERRRVEEALEHQAMHDQLTGLPNRNLLQDRLQQALLSAGREGRAVALLLIDLDGFREINEAFGHDLGDAVLQEIGPRLRQVLRESDTVARMGADEFAVILPLSSPTDVDVAASKLVQALDREFLVQGNVLEIRASMGVAISPLHAPDALSLLRRADIAMYQAKRLREPYLAYSEEHGENTAQRLTLTRELRHGIGQGQLELYYQPQLAVDGSEVLAIEALVRWRHPQHGLLLPKAFVPVAEQTGLIKALSAWVLGSATAQAQAWRNQGLRVPLAVNLSMRNLRDPALPGLVAGLLREHQLDASALVIELTETAIMTEPARTLDVMARLTDMGLDLCVDDFGTGYSSLTYLKRLPLKQVKVDQSFVADVATNLSDRVIVRSTIEMAHALGLRVVAEGIETEQQMEVLRELHCDAVQGLYFAPPSTADELWARLTPTGQQLRLAPPRRGGQVA